MKKIIFHILLVLCAHIAEKELLETHLVTAKELVIVGDKVVFRK